MMLLKVNTNIDTLLLLFEMKINKYKAKSSSNHSLIPNTT